jgi:hypothetical protein
MFTKLWLASLTEEHYGRTPVDVVQKDYRRTAVHVSVGVRDMSGVS